MEVCLPECHFPVNFLSRAFGNIPGPVSVPPFETGQFPSCLSPKNETGTPEFEILGKFPKFSTGRDISCWVLKYVISFQTIQSNSDVE